MKELISWLIRIEEAARVFYEDAASCFRGEKLGRFLEGLAEEEAWHYHAMGSAADHMARRGVVAPEGVRVDEDLERQISEAFARNHALLRQGKLSRGDLLSCVSSTEFSEWNDLFLYVVNTLKKTGKAFESVASGMEHHKRKIAAFLASESGLAVQAESLQGLSRVWRERLLVVEDSAPVAELLQALLESEGEVEIAANGREGLEKASARHFDAVISDVDMPVMNGLAFYRAICERDPDIGSRFLFLSGGPTQEALDFFRDNGIPFLWKPVSVNELRTTVREILNRPRGVVAAG